MGKVVLVYMYRAVANKNAGILKTPQNPSTAILLYTYYMYKSLHSHLRELTLYIFYEYIYMYTELFIL